MEQKEIRYKCDECGREMTQAEADRLDREYQSLLSKF